MCDGTTIGFLLIFLALLARGVQKSWAKLDNEGTIHKAAKEGIINQIMKRLK